MSNEKATVKVRVRHSLACPDRDKGPLWESCKCWKSIVTYERGTQRWKTTETQSWEKAQRIAVEHKDSLDPDKQELKRLRAAKDREAIRIEDAVSAFIEDNRTRLGEGGALRNVQTLFGAVDPVTKAILRDGHFFGWLHKQSPRLTFVSDITTAQMSAWRGTWKFGSDLTAAHSWACVVSFFAFCVANDWLPMNPVRREKIKPLLASKGNRTAIFSDAQHEAILDALPLCKQDPRIEHDAEGWERRLLTFVEMLRWGGADLIDCIQFRPAQVTNGVFRYYRQKTKQLATIPLPEHVLVLLRDLPLEPDSVGAEMPFRSRDITPASDVRKWQFRLTKLFKFAGIKSVTTQMGQIKKPHPKMFRHTCAVGHLIHGSSLVAVSKFLGHADPSITAKHYLPWVPELEAAVIAEGRKSLEAAIPKIKRGVRVVSINRKN